MPDLLYSENPPPRSTLYLNIPLGSESPATPMTAVFLSRHAAPTSTVDLLLYLHGHKADSLQIDDYLTKPQYRFRERLNAAGKAAILVAPTLGPKSQPGILATQGDAYLSDVLDGLKQYGGFEAKPTIDNLVLACHSGGGVAMLALAQTLKAPVAACWGFDCLYNAGQDDAWTAWAMQHPSASLFVFYQGSTRELSESLARKTAKLSNVVVMPSKAPNHDNVPRWHWLDRLRKSWELFGPSHG